jgi:hypothetical protein
MDCFYASLRAVIHANVHEYIKIYLSMWLSTTVCDYDCGFVYIYSGTGPVASKTLVPPSGYAWDEAFLTLSWPASIDTMLVRCV